MNQDSMNTLGLGIKAKQEDALADLMSLKTGWVQFQAFDMLKNMEDAEEATNFIFLRVWDKASLWNPDNGSFVSWFNCVVFNYLRDMLRKQKREMQKHPQVLSEDALFLLDNKCPSPAPLEKIVISEDAEKIMLDIESALEKIDNRKQRLSWILKRIEGYKIREISEMLGIAVGSVKSYVNACDRKLRDML